MSKTLDKDSVTWGQKQYHIALSPGEIGEYVLLPGDPARSDIVAKYLDQAELMANNREHRTFTGYYKGIKVSVTSTGMGCPSSSIAAEELIRIGAKNLIRIGSSAALDPRVKIGDLMITIGAMHKSPAVMPDGSIEVRDIVDIGATLDERIGDGFYFARSLKLIQHICAHPELLDRPLEEDSCYDYK